MKTQTVLLAALVQLAASLPALAADPPKPAEPAKAAADKAAPPPGPMAPPKPAPENDIIKKSVGTWTCEGTAKGPDGQEAKYKATWNVKSTLGGHWFDIVYKRAKMGPMPPFEGHATVGYNASDKNYFFIGFDSMGGWINLTSPDNSVFTGDGVPMGKKGPVKFTFVPGKDKNGKEDQKVFEATLDFGAASSHETCKK